MKFERILFYTKFREMSFNALEAVVELKKAGLKEVVLIHVIPREDVAFVPYGGYLKEEEERLKEIARSRFEDWQKTLSKRGIESKIRIEVGVTNSEILSAAEEEEVQLIVTGRKKRTLLEKIYVGSHILDLLRRSPIPILMFKYMVEYESDGETLNKVNDHIFERPLLATDWSEPSKNALSSLLALKGAVDTILLTHIIDAKLSKGVDEAGLKALETESKKRLDAHCRILADDGIQAEAHLSFGRTTPEIIKVAREHKASMIVMGRTGKDWFHEYWLGGVSHRVAEMSELPVLLVP
jgi:nucleotide-binding universal stress UspA family protein